MNIRLFSLALLLLACLRSASAAPDFEAARLNAVAANPPGVSLTLNLPPGRTQFHQGEVIPLTAAFASIRPKAYQLISDPGSRDLAWNSDAFHVADTPGAADPLAVYYDHQFGFSYSGPGLYSQPLGVRPLTIPFVLNEWLRFDAPGHYRVYLTSGRVVDAGKQPRDTFWPRGRATASNTVEFEVLPDDPAWDAQTLRQALPLLGAGSSDDGKQDAHMAAARAVRFLETPDALQAMVALYGRLTEFDSWNSSIYYQTRMGLLGYPQPVLVIQEMERRLADPDFPVFAFFLSDLAQVRFLAAYPHLFPPFIPHDPAAEKARQALLQQRLAALTTWNEQGDKDLTSALPVKRGRARAISLATSFGMGYVYTDTAAHRKLARALVPVFDDLTPEEQSSLLRDDTWPVLRVPAMLPHLRRLYANPQTKEAYDAVSMRSLALRRLSAFAPAEGRALLLAEIKSAHPLVDEVTLCSLPDRTLPAFDAVLATDLEANLHDNSQWPSAARLVERYATRAILPRVKAAYSSNGGEWGGDTQSSLLAYFLWMDSSYGLEQMKRALARRKGTGWYRSVLSDVATLAPGPDVGELAAAHLHDPDTGVEADAVKTLGACGSPAAEAPLWARMREWHQQWAGKAEQITPVSGELEYALSQALATAPGWLADRAKLQTLQSLCVTEGAHGNVAGFLRGWIVPIRIYFEEDRGEWSVVQYEHLASLAALESKLAQFPRGTRFRLSAWTLPSRGQQRQAFKSRGQQRQAFRQLKSFLEKRRMQTDTEPLPTPPPY